MWHYTSLAFRDEDVDPFEVHYFANHNPSIQLAPGKYLQKAYVASRPPLQRCGGGLAIPAVTWTQGC